MLSKTGSGPGIKKATSMTPPNWWYGRHRPVHGSRRSTGARVGQCHSGWRVLQVGQG